MKGAETEEPGSRLEDDYMDILDLENSCKRSGECLSSARFGSCWLMTDEHSLEKDNMTKWRNVVERRVMAEPPADMRLSTP